MKLIQEFSPKPEELKLQVGALERNAADAISELARTAAVRPRKVYARESGHICRPGDMVVCDGGQTIEILLVRPTPEQDGQTIVLLKTKAAGTMGVRGVQCTLNKITFVALTDIGAFTCYAVDGEWITF